MPPRRRLPLYVLLVLIIGGGYALLRLRSDPEQMFNVRGVIRAPYADGEIAIQHEEIPGYMPAMTMPFRVDPAEVRDLSPGDRV